MKKIILHLTTVSTITITSLALNAQSWSTLGNNGTNPNTNFLGTKDNKSLVVRTNNQERLRITGTGRIGIGVTNPQTGYALTINPVSSGGAIYINDPGNGYFALAQNQEIPGRVFG
jgi:hypothetical protein